jgi:hypothetical protein
MKKFIVLVILFFPASLKAQNSPFQISGTNLVYQKMFCM